MSTYIYAYYYLRLSFGKRKSKQCCKELSWELFECSRRRCFVLSFVAMRFVTEGNDNWDERARAPDYFGRNRERLWRLVVMDKVARQFVRCRVDLQNAVIVNCCSV